MHLSDRTSKPHEVWDFMIHESYNNPRKYSNDIATIIIRDTFVFGPRVKQAVLTDTDRFLSEKKKAFTAMGWGITEVRDLVGKF